MRTALFCLVVIFLVLVSGNCAAIWWDASWTFKKPVQLPDLDLNIGTTIKVEDIDFSGLSVLASLDDVRFVDENTNTELDRVCDGTSSSADGNCYFRMDNSLSSGSGVEDSTYYMYYSNAGAGAAPTTTAARTTVCDWESDTNCFTAYDNQARALIQKPDQKKYGSFSGYSYAAVDMTSLQNIDSNVNDVNYTTWIYNNNSGTTMWGIESAANQTLCWVEWNGANSFLKVPTPTGTKTISEYALPNNWYKFAIHYHNTALVYDLTVWDSNGQVLVFAGENVIDKDASPGDVNRMTFAGNAAGVYFDQTYLAPATHASGLGGSESKLIEGIDVNAWKFDGYDITQTELPVFVPIVDGNITIDFNVWNADANSMRIDINYSTGRTQGSGTVIVTDFLLDSNNCGSADFSTAQTCTVDWNIALAIDNNYYVLFDLNASVLPGIYLSNFEATDKSMRVSTPSITLEFVDENSWLPLIGLSVLIGSSTYLTNSNGIVDFNLPVATSTTYTVEAWQDNNYTKRYFEFDVNVNANIDQNLMMLRDVNGLDFNFVWYDSDETTLTANKKFYVYEEDNNIVSIRTTSASGEVSFFLDPDGNYYFITEDAYRYDLIKATFEIPKDESTLADVSPFTLGIADLASRSFSNSAVAVETYLFPNTVDYYLFDLNASQYYGRRLSVNYKGNPLTVAIQMFLPSYADGISTIIYTKDATDLSTIPNILIKSYKAIVGYGEKEIQTIRSDAAGTAAMSFIIGDEYTLEFYDAIDVFLFTKTLRPEFSSYYVYIDTGEITWDEPTIEYITVTGFPDTGYIVYDETGHDFNVVVSVTGGTIATSWFTVWNNVADTNLVFNTSCGSACGYHVARTDLNGSLEVCIKVFVVTTNDLVFQKYKCYNTLDQSGTQDFVITLRSGAFRREWGCSEDINQPCFFLLMVSTMLTIATLAAAGVGLTTDTSALSILAMICLALFTYLTWIPVAFFILACLGAFGAFIVSRRGF